MTQKPFLHIGSSVRGRSEADAQIIAERIECICRVADKFGFGYEVEVQKNVKINREIDRVFFQIPERHLNRVNNAMVNSIKGLRIENQPYSAREEIACHFWAMDTIQRASACVFDLRYGSTGVGFEIATAIHKNKPCLLLYPEDQRPGVNINGNLNRLIVTRRWNEDIERTLENFFRKSQDALDLSFRFKLTRTQMDDLKASAEKRGFENNSEYLRFLIERDRENIEATD